ncbi:hypothetical protein ABH931_007706 [Streptacidiphilus sp. MAP12-33]
MTTGGTTGDFEGDEIVPEEWPTYYTQVPVWVLLSGVSAKAYLMYAFLAEHINNRVPGQRIACPKQTAIARVLALKDDRKVAGYRRELEDLGAIRVSEYRYRGGMRRGYRYVVRFNPPLGYEGLMTLGQFYDAHPDVRSASSEGRTQAAGVVLQHVVPQQREGSSPRPTTVTAATARRRPAGRGQDAPVIHPDVALVLAALPRELRAAMLETARSEAPKTLVSEIQRQLLGRTTGQLVERVGRRWLVHRYAERLAAGELRRPVGAAVAMVRAGACPDPRCEDGVGLDDGRACPRCAERQADHAKSRRAGHRPPRTGEVSIPRQDLAPTRGEHPTPLWWECRACRDTGKGAAPIDGLCRSCRNALRPGGGGGAPPPPPPGGAPPPGGGGGAPPGGPPPPPPRQNYTKRNQTKERGNDGCASARSAADAEGSLPVGDRSGLPSVTCPSALATSVEHRAAHRSGGGRPAPKARHSFSLPGATRPVS